MQNPTTPDRQEQRIQMAEYIRDLRSFDWHFEYADDFSIVRCGKQALEQLRQKQRNIDPTGYVWLLFMPTDCRHTPATAKENSNV